MNKPIAVIAGDIHYKLDTLRLADAATRMAIHKANELNVPFIANGDTTDTKANLRGECVNSLIETFKLAKVMPYVNIGNHDKIHEKSAEHSLNFLQPYAYIVDVPMFVGHWGAKIIPYCHDLKDFLSAIRINPTKINIVHQGLKGGLLGDYINDHSAIDQYDVRGLRVISSHYHTRKTHLLENGGKWDFIGNPFSLTWGEANDPEKGFQILHEDSSLTFVPTNLRRHIVLERTAQDYKSIIPIYQADDLLWVKLKGTHQELATITRGRVAEVLGRDVFKLTLEPMNSQTKIEVTNDKTQEELLDIMVKEERLKKAWRSLLEDD